MARRTILLSGLTGNGANGLMSIVLPLGLKYYGLIVELASGTCSIDKITDFKVIVNNDLKIEQTGTEQDEINKFDGLTAYTTNKVLRIPFELLNQFKSIRTMHSTAFNTLVPSPKTKKVISAMRLEMTLASATNPSFNIYADCDDSTVEGPGAIMSYRDVADASINGEIGTTKLGYGNPNNRFWRRVFVQASVGTISKVRILWGKNNEERWNRTTTVNDQILVDNGKTKGSFYASVTDFTESKVGELWDTAGLNTGDQNLQFLTTGTSAGVNTYTVQAIGEL